MSAYTTVQLEMTDPECIKLALEEMGYPFEEHKIAQNLYGIGNHMRDQTANIIVRRQYVGTAANDVGFLKQSDGRYQMIISEFDRRQTTQGTNFLKRMGQIYGKHKVLKQVRRLGYSVTSTKTTEDGKLKIRVKV
jgi:hypothetical protein